MTKTYVSDLEKEYIRAVNIGKMKQYQAEIERLTEETQNKIEKESTMISLAPMYTTGMGRNLESLKVKVK